MVPLYGIFYEGTDVYSVSPVERDFYLVRGLMNVAGVPLDGQWDSIGLHWTVPRRRSPPYDLSDSDRFRKARLSAMFTLTDLQVWNICTKMVSFMGMYEQYVFIF